ncbi:MAG: amino acid ABC transporter permease [Sporomusaceae bacterium]|nr:amino acid ABC transporter permease [Sporomusaceae bacterium]
MELNVDFMIKTLWLVFKSVPVTLKITLVSLLAAIPFSFFMALARIYEISLLQTLVKLYVSFIRGTPMVLQILVIYSLVPSFLNSAVKYLGWNIKVFDFDPIIYAYIVFGMNTTALLSEVFRSALLSIQAGQLEAGLSIGMTLAQVYRRIIIPQALVAALPNVCNLTVNLIKNTSLAFLMTVKDITATGKIAASYGYNYIEAYLDIFLVYLVLCTVVQLLFKYAEDRSGTFRQLNSH